MARAKQTNRAEARRRYRQTTQAELDEESTESESTEITPNVLRGSRPAKAAGASTTPTGPQRPGFMSAFRGAYHPAHPREDLGALPSLLTHWSFLAGAGLVLLGAAVAYAIPGYTGSAFAWELLVLPGSALAPQLLTGFFAKRASYMLGFLIGLLQGIVFTVFVTQLSSRLSGAQFPAEQMGSLLTLSFITGPVSGALFAAAAAWYRRFLALSSPRRAQQGRPGAKPAQRRSSARR